MTVVGADLLVQALGGRGEQVAMLVYCAPLHQHAVPDGRNCLFKPWRAVDDEELGPSQTALDETTVPSRMSRTIGSSASERAFQASQSVFTLPSSTNFVPFLCVFHTLILI